MLDPNDHRQLGQRLDLFHFQEEAPGMVFWHPRGFVLYRLLEDTIRRHIKKDGFIEVRSPQVLRQPIWEASGHWKSFRQHMLVLSDEDDCKPEARSAAKPREDGRPDSLRPGAVRSSAALKPVSCPGHLEIVRRMSLSYRDLPLRVAELGLVHRYEPSGTLHGLFRLRQFTQDDGHIFASDDMVEAEVARFVRSLRALYAAFDLEEVSVAFSTRPPEREGSDEVWDRAESMLERAAKGAGLELELHPGEGAFYGPKLEMVLKDRLGRSWQCGTVQLDLVLPERFDVAYVDASGARRRPAMLHRALLGSLERFLGILLEHYQGALPAWLAPDQVIVEPVAPDSPEQRAYAERVLDRLVAAGLRAKLGARSETLARRILDAHQMGAPFVLVAGGREVEAGSVSVRSREGAGASRVLPLEEAVKDLLERSAPPI